ncbi:hypothetical protein LTR86_003511 [Recurvomyces mirabilis]|nr:hypothetical protein LTR86_003511 [Recurvomyces mirabilis]
MSGNSDQAQQAFNGFFRLAYRPIRVRSLGDGYHEILAPAATAEQEILPATVYTPSSAPHNDVPYRRHRPLDLQSTAMGALVTFPGGDVDGEEEEAAEAEAELPDREMNSDDSDLNQQYRTPGEVVTRLSRVADDLRDELVAIGESLGNAHQVLDDVRRQVDALKRMMGI